MIRASPGSALCVSRGRCDDAGVARRVALALVLLAVAVTWGKVAFVFRDAGRAAQTTRPTAVVWGNRVYSDVDAIRGWLRDHHVRYTIWAKNHPLALAILEQRP